ncbi:calmodulin-like [Haliotis rufescens]|uniref:calmodulin-like n=1 Tax=Haliotis rufescens TaxID=6454 RepID=UPI00201EE0A1|nr:calmodulin-like [Haliotis rufescens]
MAQLTQKEKQLYTAFFHQVDIDGNGYITLDELATLCKKLKFDMTRQQIVDLFLSMDLDGNFKITLDEFLAAMPNIAEEKRSHGEMRRAFDQIDKDGNGLLDADELKDVLTRCGRSLSMKEVKSLIAKVDVNGDGKLDFNEFVSLFA